MDGNRSMVGPLLVVILAGGISLLLLTASLVVLLARYFDSLIIPCLFAGVVWAIVALMTYMLSLRSAINRLHAHIETTYEVSHLVKMALDWFVRWLRKGSTE